MVLEDHTPAGCVFLPILLRVGPVLTNLLPLNSMTL